MYTLFANPGFEGIPENTTNRGHIDITVKTGKIIRVYEFKERDKDRKEGIRLLEQILRKGYAERYQADGRHIIEIGILFDPDTQEY